MTKHEARLEAGDRLGRRHEDPAGRPYIAGYRAGARKANPQIVTLIGYSQDFVDQAKCKEIALDQIARGAQVVFQVAGQCGLGRARRPPRSRTSGASASTPTRRYLGAHILTSALKRVDVAVFQTIQAEDRARSPAARTRVFDVASGGVGIGEIAARRARRDRLAGARGRGRNHRRQDHSIPETVR